MEDEDPIFEGTLLRLSRKDAKKKSSFLSKSGEWKERHYVLTRRQDKLVIIEYKKKPISNEKPHATYHLWPKYSVRKRGLIRGKEHIIQITTAEETLVLAAHSERFRDMFVFFLQTQTQLRDSLIPDCFNVRPEDSEDQRQIGARGSLCLLHISQWGVTLCLSLSRAILAQWPLKCIRFYQATGKGHFQLEAGHRAPMGPGVYNFNTRQYEDNKMYDLLDGYVLSAAGLTKTANQDPDEAVAAEHSNMAEFSMSSLDSQFDQHHTRISTDNYSSSSKQPTISRQSSRTNQENVPLPIKNIRPSLVPEQNLPRSSYENTTPRGSRAEDRDASPPLSAAAAAKRNEALSLSIPPQGKDVKPKVFSRPLAKRLPSDPLDIKPPLNEALLRKENAGRTQQRHMTNVHSRTSTDSEQSVRSEYLAMTPKDDFTASFSPSSSSLMTPPPTFYEIMSADNKFAAEQQLLQQKQQTPQRRLDGEASPGYADMSGSMDKLDLNLDDAPTPRRRPQGKKRAVTDSLPPFDDKAVQRRFRFTRMKSSSCEDFTELKRNTLYEWKNEYDNVCYEVDDPHMYDEAQMEEEYHRSNAESNVASGAPPGGTEPSEDETRFTIKDMRRMFSEKSKGMKHSISNPDIVDFSRPVTNSGAQVSAGAVKPASNFTPSPSRQQTEKKPVGFLNLSFLSKSKKKSVGKKKSEPPKSSASPSIKGIAPSPKTKSFTKKQPLSVANSDSGEMGSVNRSISQQSNQSNLSSPFAHADENRNPFFPSAPSARKEEIRVSLGHGDELPLIPGDVDSPPRSLGRIPSYTYCDPDTSRDTRPKLGRRLPSLPQSETFL